MFFVYILFSNKLNRFYIGTTDNVEKRLLEHNSGFYASSLRRNEFLGNYL